MSTTGKGAISDESSRKLGLSCAECRRSKLKCDRTFPCQSCIRRGCSGICPEGTLAATKGNKVLMAQAQRLSEQVKSLNARVRELEALALEQPKRLKEEIHTETPPSEPAMGNGKDDAEKIKVVSEAIGSLSLGLEGQAMYHGESAGSEYLQDLLPRSKEDYQASKAPVDLPSEIIDLVNAFPFGLKESVHSKSLFCPYLPSRQRATELADIYYRNVAWMYDPISYDDFVITILDPIYVLANGNLYDPNSSAVAAAEVAERYYFLARAALSLDSILLEVTCATVQALFLVFRFIYNSHQTGREERWLLSGLCVRVAYTIGLQRDSAGWNLEPEEVQRRRRLFWELFTWESWSSLVNGRPGALLIQHTDCQFAEDIDPYTKASGEKELGFHAWKFRYSVSCLSVSVEHVFSTRAPPYSALLVIDKTIRKFPIPSHLRCPARNSDGGTPWSKDPLRALQQYCTLCVRESNLLYIHRSYFAQAIRESSDNPLQHKYAPSFLATYRSACRLITSLRSLYPVCPLVSHVWFFWSGIFSSFVVLGALVVESPGCTLAKEAIHELEMTLPFFDEGSKLCRPSSTLIYLQKLYKRASSSYASFKAGHEDMFVSNTTHEPDELEVLGGRKSVITTKSNTNSPSLLPPSSPPIIYRDSDGGSSPSSQTGAQEMLAEYCQQMGTTSYAAGKGHDYEMGDAMARYAEPVYPKSLGSAISAERTPMAMDPYMEGRQSVRRASVPHLMSTSPAHANLGPGHKGGPLWHTPYQAEHHPYPQQSPGPSYMTAYQNHNAVPYSHPEHTSYGYLAPPVLEQNQDEIWRNFILTFSG